MKTNKLYTYYAYKNSSLLFDDAIFEGDLNYFKHISSWFLGEISSWVLNTNENIREVL